MSCVIVKRITSAECIILSLTIAINICVTFLYTLLSALKSQHVEKYHSNLNYCIPFCLKGSNLGQNLQNLYTKKVKGVRSPSIARGHKGHKAS